MRQPNFAGNLFCAGAIIPAPMCLRKLSHYANLHFQKIFNFFDQYLVHTNTNGTEKMTFWWQNFIFAKSKKQTLPIVKSKFYVVWIFNFIHFGTWSNNAQNTYIQVFLALWGQFFIKRKNNNTPNQKNGLWHTGKKSFYAPNFQKFVNLKNTTLLTCTKYWTK